MAGDAIEEQSDIQLYHKCQTRVPVSHGCVRHVSQCLTAVSDTCPSVSRLCQTRVSVSHGCVRHVSQCLTAVSDTCPSVSWLVTPLKSKVTFGCITRVRHVAQCLVAGDAIEEQSDVQLYHKSQTRVPVSHGCVRQVSQCLMAGDAIEEQSDIRLYHTIQTRVPVPHGW